MNYPALLNNLVGSFDPQEILRYFTYFDSAAGQFKDLSQLTSRISDLGLTIGAFFTLILSLICCFYGYRLSRFIMSISGFVIGSFLGRALICPLIGLQGVLAGLGAIVCGVLLASAAWLIYKVGLCVLAFFLTWSAAQLLIPIGDMPKVVLCIFAGAVAAILVLAFLRPGIILLTAFFGGTYASAALLTVAKYFQLEIPAVISGILPLSTGLIAAGILVQFITTKNDE